MSVTFYPEGESGSDLGFNVSNANAAALLAHIGYLPAERIDVDPALAPQPVIDPNCGALDADDVRGRCLLALAVGGVFSDEGAETIGYQGEGGATMLHVGRPAGYFADRVEQLAALATYAASQGVRVVYA